MARSARGIVDSFAAWASRQDRDDLELDVVETVLDLKANALGTPHPGVWVSGDVSALLLEALPARVSADEDYVRVIVPTLRAFLDFVATSKAWSPASDPLPVVLSELDEVAPQVPYAMAEGARLGVSDRLVDELIADGVDLSDSAAVQRWFDDFNARPEAERRALMGPLPRLAALPAVDLPPMSVLAESARAAPLLRDLQRLVAWVGQGRAVTQTGVLRPADALEAARDLGLLTDEHLGALERHGPPRTSRDLPTLPVLWELTCAAGLLAVSSTRVRPGAAQQAWLLDRDEDVLNVWADAFGSLLEQGSGGAQRRVFALHVRVDEVFLGALVPLYVGERVLVPDLVRAAAAPLQERLPAAPLDVHERLGRSILDRYLRWFESLEALRRDGDDLFLTELGRWALRTAWADEGLDVPLMGDHANATAGELLAAMDEWDQDRSAGEVAEWILRRGRERAVTELLDAARVARPHHRLAAFGLIQAALAGVAEPAMRAVLDDPVLGRYAYNWLREEGHELPVDLDPGDIAWHMVDLLAASAEFEDTEELRATVASAPWTPAILDQLWRCSHPETTRMLHLIGAQHPDKVVAKAARKAAFKAASRGLSAQA